MICPICKKRNVSAGHIMGHEGGSAGTEAQNEARRINGKLGGRPRTKKRIRELNLAELQRQHTKAKGELASLESQAQWGDQSNRFAIQHHRRLIAKLSESISRLQTGRDVGIDGSGQR